MQQIKIFNNLCELHIKYKEEIVKTFISIDDLKLIINYKWWIWQKNKGRHRYVATKIWNGKKQLTCYLHSLIINKPGKTNLVVDHMNRNTLDNRRENLRLVSRRVNVLNSDKPPKDYQRK